VLVRAGIRATIVVIGASVALIAGLARPASADSLTQQRDRIRKQRAALAVQINLAVANDRVVEAEANRLARALRAQQAAVATAAAAVAAADSKAADAQRRLDQIDRDSSAARRALVDRAVQLYEHPFESEAAVITNAANLNDYAQRQALVEAIEGKTSDLIDQFRQQHLDELDASKALIQARADADHRRAILQEQEVSLETARSSADKAHAALQARIASLQKEAADYAAQEAALEAKLNAALTTFGGSVPANYHGGLIWPVHGPVTREFGNQPGGFHPGIDIAPPYGTPIHASGTGVVIYASWESGYGNYTCISHGGGIATCYAHQSAIYVSVGQHVSVGQVIGAEGSTGNSTGPHVHFEVRVNNVPNNPRAFIPGNP
jgi:murein DD-endopeptidase MepM/ murein hydrolase activator NlpD